MMDRSTKFPGDWDTKRLIVPLLVVSGKSGKWFHMLNMNYFHDQTRGAEPSFDWFRECMNIAFGVDSLCVVKHVKVPVKRAYNLEQNRWELLEVPTGYAFYQQELIAYSDYKHRGLSTRVVKINIEWPERSESPSKLRMENGAESLKNPQSINLQFLVEAIVGDVATWKVEQIEAEGEDTAKIITWVLTRAIEVSGHNEATRVEIVDCEGKHSVTENSDEAGYRELARQIDMAQELVIEKEKRIKGHEKWYTERNQPIPVLKAELEIGIPAITVFVSKNPHEVVATPDRHPFDAFRSHRNIRVNDVLGDDDTKNGGV